MPEVFLNPSAISRISSPPPTREPMRFHQSFPGYAVTPLVQLPRLAQRLGIGKLWLKDESSRMGLPAFKILGASWAVHCALRELARLPSDTMLTLDELRGIAANHHPTFFSATDGNHGRAVARMARLLGAQARIYMPEGTVPARIDAIEAEGATVVIGGSYDDAVARAEQDARGNGLLVQDSAWEGYESVPEWIVQGYSTMLWEIDDMLAETGESAPTLVIVQIGVGSLADAVVRHYRHASLPFRLVIVGVEPDEAACALAAVKAGHIVRLPGHQHSIMAGLNCGTASTLSFRTLREGMDCFIAAGDDRAREAMRVLAEEGIVSGETGSAGLAGLLELISADPFLERLGVNSSTRALIISTEGATDPAAYVDIVGKSPDKVRYACL